MAARTTQAVLFDLDGTFADTAPDLAYALNCMRVSRQLPLLPVATTRAYTSMGARGLLGVGLDVTPEHPDYAAMRDEFLAHYEANLCRETQLFPGMAELLDELSDGSQVGHRNQQSRTLHASVAQTARRRPSRGVRHWRRHYRQNETGSGAPVRSDQSHGHRTSSLHLRR
jgi:beta-phosphoglucomutase-like phosphatase (HAD superfamily)